MADDPIWMDPPEQMLLLEPTEAVGSGLTVMVTESILLQPVAVMVSVNIYLVVVVGLTVGLALVEVYPDGLEVQL